jgi:hypothetical protein
MNGQNEIDSDTRTLTIYTDHLARDRYNFGVGISCIGNWQFTKYGVPVAMTEWNCRGSVQHAYDGTGNGNSNTLTIDWNPTVYTVPINDAQWQTIQNSLQRGDVISFWGGMIGNMDNQHCHTCLGTPATMYSANNEPSVDFDKSPPATWKWAECTSKAYFEAVNAASQKKWSFDFLREVKVHHRP